MLSTAWRWYRRWRRSVTSQSRRYLIAGSCIAMNLVSCTNLAKSLICVPLACICKYRLYFSIRFNRLAVRNKNKINSGMEPCQTPLSEGWTSLPTVNKVSRASEELRKSAAFKFQKPCTDVRRYSSVKWSTCDLVAEHFLVEHRRSSSQY